MSCDLKLMANVIEVENFIVKSQQYVQEYFELASKLKIQDPKIFVTEHDPQFDECVQKVTEEIKVAKILRLKLVDGAEKKASESELSKSAHKAKNLNCEIVHRRESLEEKYSQDVNTLSDYQILEISQNKTLDIEFNAILDKVTNLASLAPTGGEVVEKLLNSATGKRDAVAVKRKDFVKKLKAILLERDIAPEKMLQG